MWPPTYFGYTLLQAALGFLVNLLTILTVKLTSSISFKLISMAKNAAIVLISVPVFHNSISPTQVHSLPPPSPQPSFPLVITPPATGYHPRRRSATR